MKILGFWRFFTIVNPIVNETRAAFGQFLLKNSEILAKHFLGIDTSFATMSEPSTPNLGFLVQANVDAQKLPKLLDWFGTPAPYGRIQIKAAFFGGKLPSSLTDLLWKYLQTTFSPKELGTDILENVYLPPHVMSPVMCHVSDVTSN